MSTHQHLRRERLCARSSRLTSTFLLYASCVLMLAALPSAGAHAGPWDKLKDLGEDVAEMGDKVLEEGEELVKKGEDAIEEIGDEESKAEPAVPPAADDPGAEQDAAPDPASSVSPDAQAFLDALPMPEGLTLGMPLREAVAALQQRGYEIRPVAGCQLERRGPGKERIEIVLRSIPASPPQPGESTPLLTLCNVQGERIVSGVGFAQFPERASQSVAPEPEMARIAERLGANGKCDGTGQSCEWRSPGGDTTIESLTVTLSRGWGRRAEVEADAMELYAVVPGRADGVAAITQQAQGICDDHDPETVFSKVTDCACIAANVGDAYARGLISHVDAAVIGHYDEGCPASRERLKPYFTDLCIEQFAKTTATQSVRDWALGGGCACTGEKAADAYRAEPSLAMKAIYGMVHAVGPQCGLDDTKAGRAVASQQTPSAGGTTTAATQNASPARSRGGRSGGRLPGRQAGATTADFTVLGDTPAGFRPLQIWLKDDRPVVHPGGFSPLSTLDATLAYGAHQLALQRYVNLLLLQGEPGLIELEDAPRTFAAENLAPGEVERLMSNCRPDIDQPRYCSWKSHDEFQARAAARDFVSGHTTHLTALATAMPRRLVAVESAKLGEYDRARGGFPLDIASWDGKFSRYFVVTPTALFGSGAIRAEVESPLPPAFWPVNEAAAQPIVQRLGKDRSVRVAIRYAITEIRPPRSVMETGNRILFLRTEGARVYADARLTEELGVLPIDGEPAAAAARPAPPPASPPAPAAAEGGTNQAPLFILPFEIEKIDGRVVVDPRNSDKRKGDILSRWFNLVMLNENPKLIEDPEKALVFARQNLPALTSSRGGWAGGDEFARARNEARFAGEGAARIVEFARKFAMPQEVLIRRHVYIEAYDFDGGTFPIALPKDAEGSRVGRPNDDGADTLLEGYNSSVNHGLLVQWRGGVYSPDVWSIPADRAQDAVAGVDPGPRGDRTVWYVSVGRLLRSSPNRRGHTTFEADLIETRLYADPALTKLVATLPPATQVADRQLAIRVKTMHRAVVLALALGFMSASSTPPAVAADVPSPESSRTENARPAWSVQLLTTGGWRQTTGVHADSDLRVGSVDGYSGLNVTYCTERLGRTEADRLAELVEKVARLDPELRIADRCADEPEYVVRVRSASREWTFNYSQFSFCRAGPSDSLSSDSIPDWLDRLTAELTAIEWNVARDCEPVDDSGQGS